MLHVDLETALEFVDKAVMPFAHYTSRGPHIQTACDATSNLDFVIRYENLEADCAELCRRLGIPLIQLARRNKSSVTNFRKYYDVDSIRHVEDKFSSEISSFGYSFNL